MALTEELKQSILLSAMSGKLTVQNSVLENAQDIVDSIIERNTQNSKRIKTMPAIALEELPFDIPDNWRWVRLSDLTENLSDGIHGTPLFDETGDYFFINGNNLVNGNIVIKKDTQRVCEAEYLKYRKPLTDNTVLLSINGTIGNTAYYNNEPVILGKSACYIALHPEMNKEYFRLILETRFFLMYGATKATQTTIKNLSLKAMRLFPVPVPPLEEQQRIVECVNMLMGKLDEFSVIEQQLITLKTNFPADMRGAILQAAMQGKLTEQLASDSPIDSLIADIEEQRNALIKSKRYKKNAKLKPLEDADIPFDIPETWRWCKLGYCSTYGQSKEKASAQDLKSQLWSLDLEDIEKGSGRVLEKKKACDRQIAGDKVKFTEENILYSKLRPYLLKVLIADEDGICTPELIPFDMIGNINPKFILCVLRSPHVDFAINAVTYGVKMPRVGTDTMINLMIPLPPVEEQQRIVERLDTLLPLCDTLME